MVLGSFAWFGSIARKFDADSNELLNDFLEEKELDEHIDMLKVIRPMKYLELKENTEWIKKFDLPRNTSQFGDSLEISVE